MRDDVAEVLADWGTGTPGSMNGESGRALTEAVVRLIQRQAGVKTICDLGCGNGFLASKLGPLGYQVVGVDASQRLLRVADAHYRSDTVRFRCGLFGPELARQLAAEGPFDLVVSIDVVEHLYRPKTLIETIDRILKPGGRAIVCTPYHGYLKNLAISVVGGWDTHHGVHWDGGHVKFFSVATLTALMEEHLVVEGMEYFGRLPWLWKNMICLGRKP
jgi:SAM-dependent methyltransferase